MKDEILGVSDSNYPDFPVCACRYVTKAKIESTNRAVRKRAIREVASAFIARKDVRSYIFSHKGTSCYLCGDPATQIDHRIPAARFVYDKSLKISQLNSYGNLFPICASCNSAKRDSKYFYTEVL